MRLVLLAGLGLAVSSLAQEPARLFDSKQAYASFLESNPGQWIAQWHPATGTPSAIYGTGLAVDGWTENSLEHAREHANQLLVTHRDLLGLGTSTWQESIGSRMGRTWTFKFDQHFNGLPVLNGRADIRINMRGVVAQMGSVAFPIPAGFNTVPAIAEAVAVATAWAKVGEPTGIEQPGTQKEPRLVIWGNPGAEDGNSFDLAWEVAVSNLNAEGQGPVGRYYIDAQKGGVLTYISDKHECFSPFCANKHHGKNRVEAIGPVAPLAAPVPTTVTLTAWTRVGVDAFQSLSNTPLPGVILNVPGIGNRTTDANGEIVIDINSPVTISVTNLNGIHHDPLNGSSAPSGSVTVTPGVAATLQLGSPSSSELEAAHPTSSYYVDRTNEWFRSILGNSPQLNTIDGVDVNLNINSNCNAFYTNNTINFYTSGGGCANTAFSTVIAHEWGHGIDAQYGGISNSTGDGLSEGWGDIIGMYLLDTPLLGSGFQNAGVALRRGDNNRNFPQTGQGVHTAGQVWMGFAWRLRENLRASYGTQTAIQISDDIVISSIAADATNQTDAVREVFIADDDDGNLLNGTPNYNELAAAAVSKNLPYPEIQFGQISHVPLSNSDVPLTPRKVIAAATPILAGNITSVTLRYRVGNGALQTRSMVPTASANQYEALLPGVQAGSVSYYIEALHNGTNLIREPASGDHSYNVDGTFSTFWSDNFDGASMGWTSAQVQTQNDWQIGNPAGKGGTSSGVAWADPQNAASGQNCYGNDLGNVIGGTTWNGRYQPNVYNYTRSPIIDCTGKFGVTLRFNRWLTVEEGIYDQATILVNGVQVWQNPANGNLVDTAWTQVEYPLPMADNNPSVQIEFRLQSDVGLHLGGWNIDDVELGEIIPLQLDATLEMLPEQAVQGQQINIAITTNQAARPFILALGSDSGPTQFPNVPPILVGGNVISLPGFSNPLGLYNLAFNAPNVPTAMGITWYSQVVTLDANSQIVTSNQFLNLFTQ
ncbi:MAG: hypothetical protein NXI31_10130 [bacterium]|nr:hypothetical protein [bacterium]